VALVFSVALSLEMRDFDGLRIYAKAISDLEGAHETRPVQIASLAADGFVDVLDGRRETGIARLQQALAIVQPADHAPGQRAMVVRMLVEACAIAGDFRTGLAVADAALGLNDAGRLFEAEIRRLRAEFLVALGSDNEDVEQELEQALAVARHQGALMFELRAATSLLRLRLAHTNDRETREAHQVLATIVANLPEKQHSRDLLEAAALLSQA
jgi:hypothetical protein